MVDHVPHVRPHVGHPLGHPGLEAVHPRPEHVNPGLDPVGELHWLGRVGLILVLGQVHRGQGLRLVIMLSLRLVILLSLRLLIILSLRLLIILSLGRCCSLHGARGRH